MVSLSSKLVAGLLFGLASIVSVAHADILDPGCCPCLSEPPSSARPLCRYSCCNPGPHLPDGGSIEAPDEPPSTVLSNCAATGFHGPLPAFGLLALAGLAAGLFRRRRDRLTSP